MTILYVANSSKQNQEVQYRVPENEKVIIKMLKPGEQRVLHDGAAEEVDAIIHQQSRYGMRNVKEIDRAREYIGLVYSVDRPIKPEAILKVDEHNDVALEKMALQARQEGMAALDEQMSTTAQETASRVKSLSVETIEQTSGPEDSGDKKHETISVERGEKRGRRG